jgi:hypothetical protein
MLWPAMSSPGRTDFHRPESSAANLGLAALAIAMKIETVSLGAERTPYSPVPRKTTNGVISRIRRSVPNDIMPA